MALSAEFVDWIPLANGGIRLEFLCRNPGAGLTTHYWIDMSRADADALAGLNPAQRRTEIETRLGEKYGGTRYGSWLDSMIGAAVTFEADERIQRHPEKERYT